MEPDTASTTILIVTLLVLVLASAYFSSSETAMRGLNRPRLKHLINQNHRGARKANRLLGRSNRLFGALLVSNHLVKFYAGAIASVIGLRFFPDYGVEIATVVVTLVFLVFAEVAPSNIAAERPEKLAFPSSYLLQPLMQLLRPVVSTVNGIGNFVARPFVRARKSDNEFSIEELRKVGTQGADLTAERQNMLLGILELDNVTVDDIMVPRSEIQGIDIDDEPAAIGEFVRSSQHTRLPVYREEINNVIGVLHLRRAGRFLSRPAFARSDVLAETDDPFFVPEGTPLGVQLVNFQKEKQRIGLVVDEYGEVQGIVTLEDILEEIVGEFTTDAASQVPEIHAQQDGSYIIEGKALLRDANRVLDWDLPTSGPRTLNGLLVEHLELIPDGNVCLRIGRFTFETLQISDNVIRTARVDVAPTRDDADDE